MRAWCSWCDEPATLKGPAGWPAEMQDAVHAATGRMRGPGFGRNGHRCAPTDVEPALRAQAREVEREFPRWEVLARFGILRATVRTELLQFGALEIPVHAKTGGDLKRALAEVERFSPAVTA